MRRHHHAVGLVSFMRNTALSTCTTNSRGVKSSLSRMTFHSGGRCVSGLVLAGAASRGCSSWAPIWRNSECYRASPVYADGKFTIIGRDSGTISVVKAGPEI